MFGLYIISDDIYPEIHSFKDVNSAKQFALKVCKEHDIHLDGAKIDADDSGFYASGDCGYATFECRKLIVH